MSKEELEEIPEVFEVNKKAEPAYEWLMKALEFDRAFTRIMNEYSPELNTHT